MMTMMIYFKNNYIDNKKCANMHIFLLLQQLFFQAMAKKISLISNAQIQNLNDNFNFFFRQKSLFVYIKKSQITIFINIFCNFH